MVRTILCVISCALVSLGFLGAACNGASSTADQSGKQAFASSTAPLEKIPATADSARVSFRKLNAWQDDDLFCVVAIVDNADFEWRRIWVRIEYLDASGNLVLVNGDSSLVVRTFADAIPPRGSSSFFAAIPLVQFSGIPDTCRVSGAGAVPQTPGAILVTAQSGGYRIQRPDPENINKIIEPGYVAVGSIENPLEYTVYQPAAVLLFYGKDTLLYYAQTVNLEKSQEVVIVSPEGPMGPKEQRQVKCSIGYDGLPRKLRDQLIGFVDFQPFEVRK